MHLTVGREHPPSAVALVKESWTTIRTAFSFSIFHRCRESLEAALRPGTEIEAQKSVQHG